MILTNGASWDSVGEFEHTFMAHDQPIGSSSENKGEREKRGRVRPAAEFPSSLLAPLTGSATKNDYYVTPAQNYPQITASKKARKKGDKKRQSKISLRICNC